MKKLIDTTGHRYTPAEAEAHAAALQAGDPAWTYRVVHDPTGRGKSFIVVEDEDGEFIARF